MCEGPCQKESIERKKEMVKVPWLQVQEKMQISTTEDACLTKIERRRLLYAIVEDASSADQNEEGINVIEKNMTIPRKNERGCEKQNCP